MTTPISLRHLVAPLSLAALLACSSACGSAEHVITTQLPRGPEDESPGRSSESGATYQWPGIPGYATGASCFIGVEYDETAGLEETTALGFSASDVIEQFNRRAHGTLVWADGSEARIDLSLTATASMFEYVAFPAGADFCAPWMGLEGMTLTAKTSDGIVDRELPVEKTSGLALTDGKGGISLIQLSLRVAPDTIVSPLVDAAAAAFPEHEERRLLIDLSQSDIGLKGGCVGGDVLGDDPLETCNRYDGTILYESHPKDLFEDHHHIDYSMLFKRALATFTWDKPDQPVSPSDAARP